MSVTPFLNRKPNENKMQQWYCIRDVPIKFKCYELSIKFRKLLIKNDCEKWTHFEQNEMILVFEQICNFQKERMSMNECKYSALNTIKFYLSIITLQMMVIQVFLNCVKIYNQLCHETFSIRKQNKTQQREQTASFRHEIQSVALNCIDIF